MYLTGWLKNMTKKVSGSGGLLACMFSEKMTVVRRKGISQNRHGSEYINTCYHFVVNSITSLGNNTLPTLPTGRCFRKSTGTMVLFFAKDSFPAFSCNSYNNLSPFSPAVHLHSPTSKYFLSRDSATTSNSIFSVRDTLLTVFPLTGVEKSVNVIIIR